MERASSFFRGSEFPRLLLLAAIAASGWAGVWWYAHRPAAAPDEPAAVATQKPPAVETDKSIEFESVTDRSPISFLDGAAYKLLLDRARSKTPRELAAVSRRDVMLPHLWNDPKTYRGVPVHLLGSAMRVLRYPSKLTQSGWLHEAWIFTPETPKFPFVCVFEDAPEGFPIGAGVSERVVFNGYFLKNMRYQAGDAVRGAPVLVGRIGWDPHLNTEKANGDLTLKLSLVLLAVLFVISMGRWVYQMRRLFIAPSKRPPPPPSESLDPEALDAWLKNERGDDSGVDAK